jgi:dUTP pyrophosphatase
MFWRNTHKIKFITMLPDARIPTRGYAEDAGLDIYSAEDVLLAPNDSATIFTGIGVEIPRGYTGLILPRSSMNARGFLTHTGVIDPGYTGEIRVVIRNMTGEMQRIRTGERIAQLVILPFLQVEGISTTVKIPRGIQGFGSSGH